MMSTPENQLLEMVRRGEGIDLEFKSCRNQINRDVFETVCAFLNRHGGTILMGVGDDGTLQGIDPDALSQLRKDFVTAINNPQKLSPPTYLSVEEATLEGKSLLRIYVPESSQVHRCNGRIFDRNEDGDLDITNHTAQVARLYQRKQATYSENKVFPHIQLEHLRHDLIDKCRRIARINTQNHPWANMDDFELIQSAQLYQMDPMSRESGITLAGVMLFGPDQLILNVCPAHRTDLILRKINVDRYDDRDLVRTNLIESYDRIVAFVQKHLPDPFYLDGIQRISLRDVIFREVASNMLIHREFMSGAPARLIIEYGQVTTENANRPHGFGALTLADFAPFPKNPVIGAFFREILRADELGSGMRKMMKYGKAYGGADPQLIEGDLFRMIIQIPEYGAALPTDYEGEAQVEAQEAQVEAQEAQVEAQVETELAPWQKKILLTCVAEEQSGKALLDMVGYASRTGNFKKGLQRMIDDGLIELTIPGKPSSSKQKYRITDRGRNLADRLKP